MSANSKGRNLQAKPVDSSKKGLGSLTEAPITSTANRFEALSLEENMDAGSANNGIQLPLRPRTRQSRWGSDESLPPVPPPPPPAATAQQVPSIAEEQLAAYLSVREGSLTLPTPSLTTAAASPQQSAMPTGTRVAGTAPSLQQAGQTASPSAMPSGTLMGGTAPSLQHGPTHLGQVLTDSHSQHHLPSQGGVVGVQTKLVDSPEVQLWRDMGCPNCSTCGKYHPPPHSEDVALARAPKKQKVKDPRNFAHAQQAAKRKPGTKLSLVNKKRRTDEQLPPPATSGTYGARVWPTPAASQVASPAAAFPAQAHPPQPFQPIVQNPAMSDQWMELVPQMFGLLPSHLQMQFLVAVFNGTTRDLMRSPAGDDIVQMLNRTNVEATGSGGQTAGRSEITPEQLGNAYTSEGRRSEDVDGKQPRRE